MSTVCSMGLRIERGQDRVDMRGLPKIGGMMMVCRFRSLASGQPAGANLRRYACKFKFIPTTTSTVASP